MSPWTWTTYSAPLFLIQATIYTRRSSIFMITGANILPLRGTLRARLRRFRPHMEQRLLQCENRRSHTSSRATAEIRALVLPCLVTRRITPTWHCWIFISFSKLKEHHYVSGEEVAAEVKLCFCHQTAQFYHEGLKVNIWSLVKVCRLQGWICKEVTV